MPAQVAQRGSPQRKAALTRGEAALVFLSGIRSAFVFARGQQAAAAGLRPARRFLIGAVRGLQTRAQDTILPHNSVQVFRWES
jgi:hypothetical protein